MTNFSLSIITPYGKQFDDEVEALIAPGKEGSFGVLARHIPIIAALSKGIVQIKKDNQSFYFAINSGILEVSHEGRVLMLLDRAEKATSPESAQGLLKAFNPN